MGIAELMVLAVGLSMDACAVAICKGACMPDANWRHSGVIALSFGVFQGLMPCVGWLLGTRLHQIIYRFDHWVAFVLLGILGVRMVWEAMRPQEELACEPLTFRVLMLLSVATSIDALAAGIALAVLNVNLLGASLLIGIVTALLCFLGVSLGVKFGQRYQAKAQFVGGVILCLMGVRILAEHLGVFA